MSLQVQRLIHGLRLAQQVAQARAIQPPDMQLPQGSAYNPGLIPLQMGRSFVRTLQPQQPYDQQQPQPGVRAYNLQDLVNPPLPTYNPNDFKTINWGNMWGKSVTVPSGARVPQHSTVYMNGYRPSLAQRLRSLF